MSAQAQSAAWDDFPGVGPRLRERLAALGVTRPQALLTHLPLRYEDRTRIAPMGALQPGTAALVEGEVLAVDVTRGRRRMLLVRLADGTGYITLR